MKLITKIWMPVLASVFSLLAISTATLRAQDDESRTLTRLILTVAANEVNQQTPMAIGMGFADTIRDFEKKTLDECRALGVNDSMIHEDFMIGCDTMNIDAICANGKVVPIFRNGNWAF